MKVLSTDDGPESSPLTEVVTPRGWVERADDLADWALPLFVNRSRYGGYIRGPEGLEKRAFPLAGARPDAVTWALVRKHFQATDGTAVVGPYSLRPGESIGRAASADLDVKRAGDDPARNLRYAEHLWHKLARAGLRALAVDWGGGRSVHVHSIFDRDVPGADLFALGRWLVSDAGEFGYTSEPESFPKQPEVPADGVGNWLRLIGRHYKTGEYPRVFDGSAWVEGAAAVEYVLATRGDDPAMIPTAAAPGADGGEGGSGGGDDEGERGAGGAADKKGSGDRPDVFEEWLRTVTLETVVGWLEGAGHTVLSRKPGRVSFARAGKKRSEGEAFNVEVRNGCPITFNFSTNAGLPEGKGLNPVQLRCALSYGKIDRPSMAKLAADLKRELGWPEAPRAKFDGSRRQGEPGAGADGDRASGAGAERFSNTDLANARQFRADHGGRAVYASDMKRWFVFDGTRWYEDSAETMVLGLAQQTARRMAEDAFGEITAAAARVRDAGGEDEEAKAEAAMSRAKAAMSWAKQTQDMKRLAAMIKAVRPALAVPVARDVFDRNPHLLPCVNGTVDLRTGELRPHDRDDFLTKLCPTAYRPDAQAPTYLAFLGSVLGSPEVTEYVRRLSGYAVTGEVTVQSLHIFHGEGSNGKNVLLDLWRDALGEVAVTAPPELVADKGEQRHPTEKTVVRGRRLAVCDETEDDERLNARRVKQLTGGGNIVARGMHQNFFEYAPTHKLVVSTNALPEVRTNDHATWRRIRVVNFPRVFWTEADRLREPHKDYPEHLRADPDLPNKLRAEVEGVLADMVRHAVAFYAAGRQLDPPAAVMRHVAAYRHREDHVGRWLDLYTAPARFDRDDPEGGVRGERGMAVFKQFRAWFLCEIDHDEDAVPSKRSFCIRLGKRYKSRTLDGTEHYALRLLARPAEGGTGASGEVEK